MRFSYRKCLKLIWIRFAGAFTSPGPDQYAHRTGSHASDNLSTSPTLQRHRLSYPGHTHVVSLPIQWDNDNSIHIKWAKNLGRSSCCQSLSMGEMIRTATIC